MNNPALKGEVSTNKMLTKNPHKQRLRRIALHNIISRIFNNSELLSEFFIPAYNKLNVGTAIPLSASKAEVSLP